MDNRDFSSGFIYHTLSETIRIGQLIRGKKGVQDTVLICY